MPAFIKPGDVFSNSLSEDQRKKGTRVQKSDSSLQFESTTMEGRTGFCLVKKGVSALIDAMGTFIRDMEWASCIGSDLYLDKKFSWIGSSAIKKIF